MTYDETNRGAAEPHERGGGGDGEEGRPGAGTQAVEEAPQGNRAGGSGGAVGFVSEGQGVTVKTSMSQRVFHEGDHVLYHDHPGVILKVGQGDQEGLYLVRLARGIFTAPAAQLEKR